MFLTIKRKNKQTNEQLNYLKSPGEKLEKRNLGIEEEDAERGSGGGGWGVAIEDKLDGLFAQGRPWVQLILILVLTDPSSDHWLSSGQLALVPALTAVSPSEHFGFYFLKESEQFL